MTNTTPAALSADLISLREAFLASVRELVAKYPAQAANVPHYERQAATARLGVISQRVAPKGSPALEVGTLVLLWRPEYTPTESATVWAPNSNSQIGCHKWSVRNAEAA